MRAQMMMLSGALQASATAISYSTPETATFRVEPLEPSSGASAERPLLADVSTAAESSFALCRPHSVPVQAGSALSCDSQPAKQSLLDALAQHLAEAERPSDGSGNEVSHSHPLPIISVPLQAAVHAGPAKTGACCADTHMLALAGAGRPSHPGAAPAAPTGAACAGVSGPRRRCAGPKPDGGSRAWRSAPAGALRRACAVDGALPAATALAGMYRLFVHLSVSLICAPIAHLAQ